MRPLFAGKERGLYAGGGTDDRFRYHEGHNGKDHGTARIAICEAAADKGRGNCPEISGRQSAGGAKIYRALQTDGL